MSIKEETNIKTFFVVSGAILLVALNFYIVLLFASNPEELILGNWKEVHWKYEKSNEKKIISDEVKDAISQNLIIHKSEVWEFRGDKLIFKKGNISKTANWKLKGNGNILKIEYLGETSEYYKVKELTKNKLVLHFDNDLHARGIIQIEFRKN